MKCPTCHADLPKSVLACPCCIEQRSHAAYVEYQRLFLPAILNGQSDLRFARTVQGLPHLELFGDPHHAYCGLPLKQPRRSRRPYKQFDSGQICAACCTVLQQLLEPAHNSQPKSLQERLGYLASDAQRILRDPANHTAEEVAWAQDMMDSEQRRQVDR